MIESIIIIKRLFNMKKYILLVCLLILTGCVSEYKVPKGTHKTSILIMHTYTKAENTNTFFINVDNSYTNNVNNGTIGQKKIAHLSTNHASAIKTIKANAKFRMLIRHVKMYGILGSVCDTVIAFYPQNGLTYTIDTYSDMDSTNQNRCSAKLYKITNGKKSRIRPSEYSSVAN